MLHETLDLAAWERLFPLAVLRRRVRDEMLDGDDPDDPEDPEELERLIRLNSPGGGETHEPHQVAIIEQVRREAFAAGPPPAPGVACDVFAFKAGEAPDRRMTKLGGLPLWPRRRAWPAKRGRGPLPFLCQVCFADSRDVCCPPPVPPLPGDVLLVFGEHRNGDGDFHDLTFAWMPLDADPAGLVGPADVPPEAAAEPIVPCYGVRHRTHDLPDEDYNVVEFDAYDGDWSDAQDLKDGHVAVGRFARYPDFDELAIAKGTKIGGVPWWIQGESNLPGRFLCAIGSVYGRWDRDPQEAAAYRAAGWPLVPYGRTLHWGDAGLVYVFIDDAGQVHATGQCH